MMAKATTPDPVEDRGSLLVWIIPMSIALHLALVAVLPRDAHAPVRISPTVIELAAEVPPEPPPPPTPAKIPQAPQPAAEPAKATSPRPAVAERAVLQRAAPSDAPPLHDAPMDFTSTMLTNATDGIATGGGGAGPIGAPRSASPAPPTAAAVARPRFVPAGSLARSPRAPGLDAVLERNYPVTARRSGISGKAVLRVEILPDGRVGKVENVSESDAGFGEACSRTVRAARWEPPLDREGHAVATEITYVCKFEIRS
jgi:protein TonB